jgi:hypothetical protein
MDSITLIVAALAAGAGLGVHGTASAMVRDACAGLKALVRRGLGGGPGAEWVLARHEQALQTWQAPFIAELAETGADSDRDLIAAADALLHLVSEAKGEPGKYTFDVRRLGACTSGTTAGRTARSAFRQAVRGRGR